MEKVKLETMPKAEKKIFLSMDLAERMMRIEQSVGASFNKYVPYYQTEYFKSMSGADRERFQKYLKNKKKKKFGIFTLAILPLFLFIVLQLQFTGNIVRQNLGFGTTLTIDIILIIVALVLVYAALNYFRLHRRHEDKFVGHLRVLEHSLRKKITKGF
jgi:hypothetical protein